MEPFVETIESFGLEWADGNARLEVQAWPDGKGVDVRLERGATETHSYGAAELYALATCIGRAIEAGRLKPGHAEPPADVWRAVRAWFFPKRR